MQLKHCSSDHNTSRDLEFDKSTKIGNHGCYKFKEKGNLRGTHYCAMNTSFI